MRMQVRCCCNPAKLLGTVEVGDSTKPREVFVTTPGWTGLRELADFAGVSPTALVTVKTITLRRGRVRLTDGTYIEALASLDNPIEELRKIPSFIEAKP